MLAKESELVGHDRSEDLCGWADFLSPIRNPPPPPPPPPPPYLPRVEAVSCKGQEMHHDSKAVHFADASIVASKSSRVRKSSSAASRIIPDPFSSRGQSNLTEIRVSNHNEEVDDDDESTIIQSRLQSARQVRSRPASKIYSLARKGQIQKTSDAHSHQSLYVTSQRSVFRGLSASIQQGYERINSALTARSIENSDPDMWSRLPGQRLTTADSVDSDVSSEICPLPAIRAQDHPEVLCSRKVYNYKRVQQKGSLQKLGILMLEDVQLLPKHTDLSKYFAKLNGEGPMNGNRKRIHHPVFKHDKPYLSSLFDNHIVPVKYDPALLAKDEALMTQYSEMDDYGERRLLANAEKDLTVIVNTPPSTPMPEHPEYADVDSFKVRPHYCYFIIFEGAAQKESSPYQLLLNLAPDSYAYIEYIVEKLEMICVDYCIPKARISYLQVLDLAEAKTKRYLTISDLRACFFDVEGMKAFFALKDYRRFHSTNSGFLAAVLRIQGTVRMKKLARFFRDRMIRHAAARKLWFYWQRKLKRREIEKSRERRMARHRERAIKQSKLLLDSWETRYSNNVHVVIHCPSISCDSLADRVRFGDPRAWQRNQFGRLLELTNSGAQIIYIHLPGNEEHEAHLQNVLNMSLDIDGLISKDKLTFVTPEAYFMFKDDCCLSAMLTASPKALASIKKMIKGRISYIVPGIVGTADLELSSILECPLFSSEWDRHLELSLSGQRLFLQAAKHVQPPPGAGNIRSKIDLYSKLKELIQSRPEIGSWIVREDSDIQFKSFAYLRSSDIDPDTLNQSVHDAKTFASAWDICMWRVVHMNVEGTGTYTDWDSFLEHSLKSGVFIEASAVQNDAEENLDKFLCGLMDTDKYDGYCFSLHFYVPPSGLPVLVGSNDRIYLSDFKFGGALYPQSLTNSVECRIIASDVSNICLSGKIFGYVSVDFVRYHNSLTGSQELWCTSFKPYFTDELNQFMTACLLSNCRFSPLDNRLIVNKYTPLPEQEFLKMVPHADPVQFMRNFEKEDTANQPKAEYRSILNIPEILHSYYDTVTFAAFKAILFNTGLAYKNSNRTGLLPPVGVWISPTFHEHNKQMICIQDDEESAIKVLLQGICIMANRLQTKNVSPQTNALEIAIYWGMHLIQLQRAKSMYDSSKTDNDSSPSQYNSELLNALEQVLVKVDCLPPVAELQYQYEQRYAAMLFERPIAFSIPKSRETADLLAISIPSTALFKDFPDFGNEELDILPMLPLRTSHPYHIPLGLSAVENYKKMVYVTLGHEYFDQNGLELTQIQVEERRKLREQQELRKLKAKRRLFPAI